MSVKWGLSVLDWRSHAINEHAKHPLGVFKAECGHLLMMVTTLREKPFGEVCAALRFDRAMTEVPGRIRPPRSGDNEPDPPVLVTDHADSRPGCDATTHLRCDHGSERRQFIGVDGMRRWGVRLGWWPVQNWAVLVDSD